LHFLHSSANRIPRLSQRLTCTHGSQKGRARFSIGAVKLAAAARWRHLSISIIETAMLALSISGRSEAQHPGNKKDHSGVAYIIVLMDIYRPAWRLWTAPKDVLIAWTIS
jgi:hypothetical protein